MGAHASLDQHELSVEPGEHVTAQLRVRNAGTVVDELTIEPLGSGASWIDAEPSVVSLFPGAEETITVTFRPPRQSSVEPGPTPFGLKVHSREDAAGSHVEEGIVTVGTFAERTVELHPLTARGRRKARFELAIDNRGNAPVHVSMAGSDTEEACDYQFDRATATIKPGEAHVAKFDVVPRKAFWRGPPQTHQFQVVVGERPPRSIDDLMRSSPSDRPDRPDAVPAGADAPPAPEAAPGTVAAPPAPPAITPPETVNGTMLHEALLPPWLIKAVLAVIAAALLLWLLWMTLLKPTVESAAKDAVAEPIDALNERLDEAADSTVPTTSAAPPTSEPAPGGDEPTGGGAAGAPPTTTPANGGGQPGDDEGGDTGDGSGNETEDSTPSATTTTVEQLTPFGNPTDFQLGVGSSVPVSTSEQFDQTFDGQFALTDIVLQNPAGDFGRVEISRDGNILFTEALENFRSLDWHFVAPYSFEEGQMLRMTIGCATPAPGNDGCSTSGSFAGFTR